MNISLDSLNRDTSEELGLGSKNVTRYLENKICDIGVKKQQHLFTVGSPK